MHSSNPADWTREAHKTETTTVVLHGALAKQFGRRHELGVSTAAEAAYALCSLHPEFRAAFQDGYYRVIRGSVAKGLPLTETMLHMRIGRAGEIHFVPAARGSKRGGGSAKAIIGAVIIVAAVVASGGTLAAPATIAGASLGVSYGAIAVFGASMLLAGISQIISPQPTNNSTQTDPRQSFGLSGQFNSVEQGTPIPVVYGRQRVGSVVGSFGYSAEDYSPPANTGAGGGGANGTIFQRAGSAAIGSGGGGKGGGSSGGAKEAPNTLRSNAVVRVIDLLSEGPIGGLVDGAKSIFFNGTPLMASDGSFNFQGVTYEVRLGYPDQAPVPGYPAVEQTLSSELGLPVDVKKLTPKTVTVTSNTATAARVTISIPSLFTQDSTNGDLKAGPNLDFMFEVRRLGGNWTSVVVEHIRGQKCVSNYQRSYRLDLPGAMDEANRATSWDIRMVRISPDDVTSNVKSETRFDSVTLITDHTLTYANTAAIFLTIDASAFGSQVPTRQYEIDGIVCQVPLNYDAVGHTYATTGPGTSMGTWDGASWKPAVTSNPAWCLYDLFSNARYGMGLPARVLTATRYDLFPISQYCDGRVPSGYKDANGNAVSELRYALNVAMTTQEDAYRVIQSMVSSFRGMSYWGAGRVVVTADMPTTPSSVLNQSNVIDGEFQYEGTSLKSRHTIARVAWQNPANSYKVEIEPYEDFDAVVSLGQIPVDISGFGVTSRGLARRLGKWLLETERHQNETFTCKTGMEHLRVRPGDVTEVADPAFIGMVAGGRTGSGSTATQINLDRALPLAGNLLYTLALTLPDGTVERRTLVGGGTTPGVNNGNVILLATTPFSLAPDADASWVLSSSGPPGPHGPDQLRPVSPRLFRILAITEPSRGTFGVIGVNQDPNKYARVEYGLKFDPTPYSILGELLATPIPPPSNVSARDPPPGVGSTTIIRATVSCTPASDPRIAGQQFRAVGPEQRTEAGDGASFDFDGLQLGTYVFGARSVGRDGRASIWVDADPTTVDGLADPPTAVTGLTAEGGALAVDITFNPTSARDLLHYEIWRSPAPNNGVHPFPFTAFVPTGSPAQNGATLLVRTASTRYHDQGAVLGPDKAWAYWVRPVNTTLVPGAFVGPAKALTTYYLTDNLEEAIRNTAPIAQELLGDAPTVGDLNTPGTREGQLVYNKTDRKLYSWSVADQQWKRFIPLIPDSTGKLTAEQIGAINQTSIQGSLTPEQTQALLAGIQAGTITSDKIASLVGAKVTGLLSNATMLAGQIYDVDPTNPNGPPIVGVNTTSLLGNLAGSRVTGLLPNATITGQQVVDVDPATGNPITGISVSRLKGNLPVSRIYDVDPVTGNVAAGVSTTSLLGNLAATRVTDVDPATGNVVVGLSAARLLGQVNTNALPSIPTTKLVGDLLAAGAATLSLNSAGITGTLAAARTAALQALSGQITTTQISDNAITAPMIQADVVKAKLVGAYRIDADNVNAAAITVEKLAVGSPNNSIANSCFYLSAEGWAGLQPVPVVGSADQANYDLDGLGAGKFLTGLAANAYADCYYTAGQTGTGRAFDASVPCLPGEVWEAQLTYIPLAGTTVEAILFFASATGTQTGGAGASGTFLPPANGSSLGNWQVLAARAAAPAGTVAVSLVIRIRNTGPSTATVGAFVTRTLLGRTVPNATSALPWTPGGIVSITGGLIRSDAVITRHLVAGAVVTSKLDAGAVTAEKLAVGSASNVIWNASCVVSADGWVAGGSLSPTLGFGRAGLTVTGEGTGEVGSAGQLATGQSIYAHWDPSGIGGVPIVGGEWYEAQARLAGHRVYVLLQMQFVDAAGTLVGFVNSPRYAGLGGGTTLSAFHFAWCKAQAPSTAVRARLFIYGTYDGASDYAAIGAAPYGPGGNPYVFFTRASLGASTPVAMALSQAQPWQPGGTTEISGGILRTNAVVGRHILAGAVTTDKLTVGSPSNTISNSCFSVSAEGWKTSAVAGVASIVPISGSSNQAAWSPLEADGGALLTNSTTLTTGQYADYFWSPAGTIAGRDYNAAIPVTPGVTYEAQARFITQAGSFSLFIIWVRADGTSLPAIATTAAFVAAPSGGTRLLADWQQATIRGAAPAGAAFATLMMRVTNTTGAPTVPAVFVTRTLFGTTVPNATGPLAWVAGGSTSVDGANVKTGTVLARAIAANQISTRELAVGSSANSITNSCFAVTTDGWLGGFTAGSTGTLATCASALPAYNTADGVGVLTCTLVNSGWGDFYYKAVSCIPGETLEAQAMMLPIGANATLYVEFVSKTGANVGFATGSSLAAQATPAAALQGTLTPFTLMTAIAVVPAGAAAARLYIRFATPNSLANCQLFITRAGLGRTVAGATQVSAWSAGGVTSIGGGMIVTDSVVTRHLGSGSVTTDKLTVGTSANLIWNSCCSGSTDGWALNATQGGGTLVSTVATDAMNLAGFGSGVLGHPGTVSGGNFLDACWWPQAGILGLPCLPGQAWEAQARVLSSACRGGLLIYFFSAAGTSVGSYGVDTAGASDLGQGGARLDLYRHLKLIATAPTGAAFVSLHVRLDAGTAAGQFVVFTQAMLAQTVPNASEVSAWSPGGATYISGGAVRTNTLEARSLRANQIGARELAVGGGANVVWNHSPQLSGEGWTGGVSPAAQANPGWALVDGNGHVATTLAPGQVLDAMWLPEGTGQAVIPGEWWEGQAMVLPLYATGQLYLQWNRADGSDAGASVATIAVTDYVSSQPADQKTLAVYKKLWVIAQAPATATSVRLVLRIWNNSGTSKNPTLFFARALLGLTVANATQASAWSPGGLTTVAGGAIKSDAILTRHLGAGTVTAEKITVAGASNVIGNSCCVVSTEGWAAGGSLSPVLGFGRAGVTVTGEGTGEVAAVGQLANGQAIYTTWDAPGSTGVPIVGGEWYEAQARLAGHRVSVLLQLQFLDAANAVIAAVNSQRYAGLGGGTTLSNFHFAWAKGQAPSNAVRLRLVLYGIYDGASDYSNIGAAPNNAGGNPYLFFTRASLGVSNPVPMALSQAQPWQPGGVTQISSGMIRTDAVVARTVAANTLTGDKFQANQIGARELAVGNSANSITNSCFAITTEGWTVGFTAGSSGTLASCASVSPGYNTADGVGVLTCSLVNSGYADVVYKAISCVTGETLEAQAMVLPIGAGATLFLEFLSKTGTSVGYGIGSSLGAQPAPAATLQGTLTPFTLMTAIAVVPAGAASARLTIRIVTTNALANCQMFMSRTALGRTFAGATAASPWAAGGATSIGGGMIVTESLVARNFAAGSVTAEKVAVASASNVISNPTPNPTTWGWKMLASAPSATIGSVLGDGMAPAIYSLAGEGTGVVRATSIGPGQAMVALWDPDSTNGVVCVGGEWWEAQGYYGAHRCRAYTAIEFYDTAGAYLGGTSGGIVEGGPGGGSELSQYGFSWCKAQAPAGATRLRVYAYAVSPSNGSTGSDPYLFFTRMVLGRTNPLTIAQGAQPQPFQVGGTTQIVGGQLKTGSVTARAIGAGEVTAEKVSVGSATNLIWNGCCGLSGSGWRSGVAAWPAGSIWALAGFGTGFLNLSLGTDQTTDVSWAPNDTASGSGYLYDGVNPIPWGAAIPCTPGVLMEAQAKVITHRCSAELFLLFLGVNPATGTMELLSAPTTGAQSFAPATSGRSIASYAQLSIRGTVPANATHCTLMMRMGNTAVSRAVQGASSGGNAYLMFTQAGLGTCLPNVPAPMPWAPGGVTSIDGGMIRAATIATLQLSAGAVQAGNIAAGAVQTGALAAGSVTAEKAAFGSPSNLIWNPCPQQGTEGWNLFTYGQFMPAVGDPKILMKPASQVIPTFDLVSFGSAFTQYVGAANEKVYATQGFVWDWKPEAGRNGVPCAGGQTWGAAALLLSGNNADAVIQIIFFNYAGDLLGSVESAHVVNNAGQFGGVVDDQYTRVTCSAVAPGGSNLVMLRIRANGSASGASNPFFVWSKAQLGQMPSGSTAVGPWVPGGVTTIHGNMVKTGTLDANRINTTTLVAGSAFIQALTATTVTAGTVKSVLVNTNKLTASEIDVDNLTVGGVKAGAIGADQLASNAIFARHLAAEQIITLAAQIGVGVINAASIQDATIQNAKIQNLTVAGVKIKPNAITDVGWTEQAGVSTYKSLYVAVEISPYSNGVVLWLRAYLENSVEGQSTGEGSGGEGGSGSGSSGDGGGAGGEG